MVLLGYAAHCGPSLGRMTLFPVSLIQMQKSRLEAFSDGVIAIILTIMVLDLKVPKEATVESMAVLWPTWVAYTLSYYNVLSVWLNHHDVFASVYVINRRILVLNGSLLFCMSLIPFATAFAGETHWAAPLSVGVYGLVMAAVSFLFVRLRLAVSDHVKEEQALAQNRFEVRLSSGLTLLFLAGSALGWFYPRLALALFMATPVLKRLARLRSSVTSVRN